MIAFRALDPRVGEYGPAEVGDGTCIDKGDSGGPLGGRDHLRKPARPDDTRTFTVRPAEDTNVNVVVEL